MKERYKIIIGLGVLLIVSILVLINGIEKESEWSIGIYTGESVFDLIPYTENPVLTGEDVNAEFVADPFIIKDDKWYMFFEVFSDQGDIGLAVSEDGLNWEYGGIVVDEEFHLSYPYVFRFEEEYYMIPESNEDESIRLYKAVNFPTEWEFVKELIKGKEYVDPSLLYSNGYYWIFVSDTGNDDLYLFYSEDILGEWTEHPMSPVIKGDANIARPAGRVLVEDDKIVRFAQDDKLFYGGKVRGFEITKLTTAEYEEEEIDFMLKGKGIGWSRKGMHHIDYSNEEGIAAVDGVKTKIKIYDLYCRVLSVFYDLIMRIQR